MLNIIINVFGSNCSKGCIKYLEEKNNYELQEIAMCTIICSLTSYVYISFIILCTLLFLSLISEIINYTSIKNLCKNMCCYIVLYIALIISITNFINDITF
jgi:hypothetical protein